MLTYYEDRKTVEIGDRLQFIKLTDPATGEQNVHMRIYIKGDAHHLIIPPVVFGQFLQYMEELKCES